MKNLMKLGFVITSLVLITLTSCKKDKITYSLNFEADHWISEENMFADPSAYYSWSVDDEDGNSKYDISGSIKEETVTGSATAKTGDWIWIYISVNDAFDNGSVSCKSTDGEIFLYTSTDNMYINESDYVTAKSVCLNGTDTIIPIRQVKFQIK